MSSSEVESKAVSAAYAQATGATCRSATRVTLRQTGRMRQNANDPWRNFSAKQTIIASKPEFSWKARTGPLGAIQVIDSLAEEAGALSVKLLGLFPLVTLAASPELTRGQYLRYLAEIPWCPIAAVKNKSLRWDVDGTGQILLSVSNSAAQVTLTLDDDGLVTKTFAPDRPRTVGNTTIDTPWEGHFSDYRDLEGLRLPFAGEVGWWLNGVYTACWEGRVTDWQSN